VGRFSPDTLERAERVQVHAHANLTPQERYLLAVEMSDNIRDIALAGLRARNPGIPEARLMQLFLERVRGWRISAPKPQGGYG
jgi:hypothetical protein